jgi:two-component system response regulator CpxR
VIEANGVRLNTTTLEASHDGIPIVLTWVESEILGVLIRSAGRVVSRDELSALLNHRQATPFERSIDVHISRLRKKLGDPHLIATIRGDGYMFRTKPLRASSNAVQDASRGA